MDTLLLQQVMCGCADNYFRRVYACDQLPLIEIMNLPACFIVNTDQPRLPGQHSIGNGPAAPFYPKECILYIYSITKNTQKHKETKL